MVEDLAIYFLTAVVAVFLIVAAWLNRRRFR